MIKRIFTLITVIALHASAVIADDFIIVGANVIDGSGAAAKAVNVRISDGKIAAVGAINPATGEKVIDAKGLTLAPGFIDSHSHHDIGLKKMPDALGAVSQGITTIIAGQDGGQPYPLADFYADLNASPVAINVAAYAGHGTIRGQVMGKDYKRHATAAELEQMKALLRTEMEAGALGFGTGLEYDPGSFSSHEEVIALAKVAADYGGRYISHIRSEDQYFWQGIDEAINVGRVAKLPVRISHIKLAMTRWWGQTDRLIKILDAARAEGIDVSADIYPYTAWNTSFSWLTTLFPERDLTRREGAVYILNEMLSPEGVLVTYYHPDPSLSGKSIADIAKITGEHPDHTLMRMLAEDQEHGEKSDMLGFAMNEKDIETLMQWPHTVVGSDGELAGTHPRGFGTFPRFLGHYIRMQKIMSLEEAIHRITYLPAQQVGITDRGLIKKGFPADLVLFDPAIVIDKSTPAAPHTPSVGIKKVWVAGTSVFDGGKVTNNRPGVALEKNNSI